MILKNDDLLMKINYQCIASNWGKNSMSFEIQIITWL